MGTRLLAWQILLASTLAAAACSSEDPASSADAGTPPTTQPPVEDSGSTTPQPGSDAATPVDAGADTGSDAGDPCAGRLVCDSFEDRAVGGAPGTAWKVETATGGPVTVSDTRAYGGGKRSVKLTTPTATYQRAMMVMTGGPLFAAASTAKTTLYGRMMVWLETPAANGVHWTMLAGEGPVASKPGVRASSRYGGQQMGRMMANYDTSGAKSDCWQHSATVMPTGKWACFAWKLAGPKNDMTLAMDGKDIADLKVGEKGQGCISHDLADVWLPPTFERAALGWESYQQDLGHTMYIDDVILDDQPIACP